MKTILYTPPALMFASGGLFAEQKIEPLFRPRIIPKGQKIRAAQVGVFNRGGSVLKSFNQYSGSQIDFRAFADVAFTSYDSTMKGFDGVPCYRDYRQMLEEMHDKIDAVIVATPDHSHFPMVMHAMLLGKHVYVEKPMAQNVYECRLLAKAAKACGVVTQMGNQGHSGSGTFQFAKWVDEGLIKNVKRIDAWMNSSRRWHGWTYDAYPEAVPPAGYDWDQWLGRRPFRPFSDKLIGGNWRCWYNFGCGAMGDWGAHILDAIHRYLKLGQPYEISTKVIGPSDLYYPQGSVITFKFKARGSMPPLVLRWFDGQGNRPPLPKDYTDSIGNVGSFIYGQDNVIKGGSHGAAYNIIIDKKMMEMQRAGKLPKPRGGLSNHYHNFLNACQEIEPANSPFEVAAQLAELLCLGCIGQRFGGTLKYDAAAMRITNHPEANKMLKGPAVRQGWEAYDKLQPVKSKKSQIANPDKVRWQELFTDKDLSNWENPYDYGKAEFVDGVVNLTSSKGKWFLLTR
ncbi:MAG: Gfo/Idh/MocA family oxidoreductase [Planctomycetes bacterium]|nr:Gfo/Idh/MocA family oxidoreductase [Planctomycetota bacterium]